VRRQFRRLIAAIGIVICSFPLWFWLVFITAGTVQLHLDVYAEVQRDSRLTTAELLHVQRQRADQLAQFLEGDSASTVRKLIDWTNAGHILSLMQLTSLCCGAFASRHLLPSPLPFQEGCPHWRLHCSWLDSKICVIAFCALGRLCYDAACAVAQSRRLRAARAGRGQSYRTTTS
jgi:hypothetical protein